MTEFDGSTMTDDQQPHTPAAVAPEVASQFSALEQLRAIVDERDDDEQTWSKVIARGGVRVTCSTTIPNAEYQRMMQAALPKRRRGGGTPDMSKINQLVLTSRAILYACELVEVRNPQVKKVEEPGAWIPVTDPANGTPLRLDDDTMLTTFRTPDAAALVIRLFGRDADVISAGLELLEESGYIPGEEDESDPT